MRELSYDVVARTVKHGFLAYEFRIKADDMETDRAYQELIKDKRYTVVIKPVLTVQYDTTCELCGKGQIDSISDDMTWCKTCNGDICGSCDCGHNNFGA